MAFYARAAEFLTDRVATRLVRDHVPRGEPTRAELEVQAQEEMQACIDRGRPGPEEAERSGPAPDWAEPRRRPTRPLDVVAVRLDVIGATSPEAAEPARRPRVAR